MHALLAGDERGHCPEQLTDVDAAMTHLEQARWELLSFQSGLSG